MKNMCFGKVLAAIAALGLLSASSRVLATETCIENDIVENAVAADQFKTLVTAVQAAELVDVLKGKGPFTVFAPNDAAFAKIPSDQIAELLKDKKALQGVLTYHVVPGKVMAADVVKLTSAKTVSGQPLKITVSGGMVKVNDAKVVTTDLECSNGVIHVIDTVLLPPAE